MSDADHRAEAQQSLRSSRSRGGIEHIYRERVAALTRRVRRQIGSSEEAKDLVHDAFARLAGARVKGELRNPGAFLNRIVRNLLIDRARRFSVRPQHLALGTEVEIGVAPDQGDAIELEQMRERYRQIVDSLPPRMRDVFVLHRIDGLSYRDIAVRLDISVRTVEWHIAEAIVRISRELDEA